MPDKKVLQKGYWKFDAENDPRTDQLRNVTAVFSQAKLALKASEIDRLIDTAKRPRVGLKNGVDNPKRA